MYVRPMTVNTGGGVAATGSAMSVSLWLGVMVAVFTLAFAVLALTKIAPPMRRNRRFSGR